MWLSCHTRPQPSNPVGGVQFVPNPKTGPSTGDACATVRGREGMATKRQKEHKSDQSRGGRVAEGRSRSQATAKGAKYAKGGSSQTRHSILRRSHLRVRRPSLAAPQFCPVRFSRGSRVGGNACIHGSAMGVGRRFSTGSGTRQNGLPHGRHAQVGFGREIVFIKSEIWNRKEMNPTPRVWVTAVVTQVPLALVCPVCPFSFDAIGDPRQRLGRSQLRSRAIHLTGKLVSRRSRAAVSSLPTAFLRRLVKSASVHPKRFHSSATMRSARLSAFSRRKSPA